MFLTYNVIVESNKSCSLPPTIVASSLPSRKARVGKVLQSINISTILLAARDLHFDHAYGWRVSYEMLRYQSRSIKVEVFNETICRGTRLIRLPIN